MAKKLQLVLPSLQAHSKNPQGRMQIRQDYRSRWIESIFPLDSHFHGYRAAHPQFGI